MFEFGGNILTPDALSATAQQPLKVKIQNHPVWFLLFFEKIWTCLGITIFRQSQLSQLAYWFRVSQVAVFWALLMVSAEDLQTLDSPDRLWMCHHWHGSPVRANQIPIKWAAFIAKMSWKSRLGGMNMMINRGQFCGTPVPEKQNSVERWFVASFCFYLVGGLSQQHRGFESVDGCGVGSSSDESASKTEAKSTANNSYLPDWRCVFGFHHA